MELPGTWRWRPACRELRADWLSTWFAGCLFCCQKADAIWQLAEGETWDRSWRSWDFSKLKTLPTSSINLSQDVSKIIRTWHHFLSFGSRVQLPTAVLFDASNSVYRGPHELAGIGRLKGLKGLRCVLVTTSTQIDTSGDPRSAAGQGPGFGDFGDAPRVKERKGQICGVGWGSMLEDVGWMMASWGRRLISQTWQFFINFLVFWWQQLLAAEERNDFQATRGSWLDAHDQLL